MSLSYGASKSASVVDAGQTSRNNASCATEIYVISFCLDCQFNIVLVISNAGKIFIMKKIVSLHANNDIVFADECDGQEMLNTVYNLGYVETDIDWYSCSLSPRIECT